MRYCLFTDFKFCILAFDWTGRSGEFLVCQHAAYLPQSDCALPNPGALKDLKELKQPKKKKRERKTSTASHCKHNFFGVWLKTLCLIRPALIQPRPCARWRFQAQRVTLARLPNKTGLLLIAKKQMMWRRNPGWNRGEPSQMAHQASRYFHARMPIKSSPRCCAWKPPHVCVECVNYCWRVSRACGSILSADLLLNTVSVIFQTKRDTLRIVRPHSRNCIFSTFGCTISQVLTALLSVILKQSLGLDLKLKKGLKRSKVVMFIFIHCNFTPYLSGFFFQDITFVLLSKSFLWNA